MLFTTMGDKSKPAVLFFHAMGVTGASSEPVAKCLYWSKGGTLKKIMWCDDEAIKPYFIAAGKALTYGNMRRQMADSLENKPFPAGRFAAAHLV